MPKNDLFYTKKPTVMHARTDLADLVAEQFVQRFADNEQVIFLVGRINYLEQSGEWETIDALLPQLRDVGNMGEEHERLDTSGLNNVTLLNIAHQIYAIVNDKQRLAENKKTAYGVGTVRADTGKVLKNAGSQPAPVITEKAGGQGVTAPQGTPGAAQGENPVRQTFRKLFGR
ncbi:MAG: hypothetical protein OEY44_02875 [Candidatus Peregrinibacteria bacterium]|nr:hypothetical protein [Candidatus Peregrinibacteria bacterium]